MNTNNNNNNGWDESEIQFFDKFTKEAKQALVVAQEKAKASNINYVGTEHILIGILSQINSLGSTVLKNFGISLDNVNYILKTVGRHSKKGNGTNEFHGLSGFAKKVIEDAVKCAHEHNHSFIGTEHLLYSLVTQHNTAATVILENMKISAGDIKKQIDHIFAKNVNNNSNGAGAASGTMSENGNPFEVLLNTLQNGMGNNSFNAEKTTQFGSKENTKKSKTPALDFFTTDLTQECRDKKVEPIIGRVKEIERMMSILCRKTKNNPVLIGEPGVGKTAVVEGLAHALTNNKVPDKLIGKRLLSLSMTSVVAGTKYRGEFEERVKQIIDEASTVKDVIIFIDELHTLIGAGSAEGSLDAANILKPALSRAKVQIVGATTTNEYRKNIETDSALERRFQTVMINEPSKNEAMEMISGIREIYEDHHNLNITKEAIVASVELSSRYLTEKYLPDKAIDLIDEASALMCMNQKKDSSDIIKVQNKLKDIVQKKEFAVSNQDYEKAHQLKKEEYQLREEIKGLRKVEIPRDKREKLTEDHVSKVISKMTGIPVSKLVCEEKSRLLDLENVLSESIIGQEDAIRSITQAIKRSRVGISDRRRPIGSFIFLGPTGVGKTELVKTITKEVYLDESSLIKLDMSEFMERHNTSRLVGATAGYVGYEDGGQLTEAVRRKPYSVILFDEIEKAHPDVFNLLLQILEDGELTDAKGRKVDFKNTIIIMTSNIGANKLTKSSSEIGFTVNEAELHRLEHDFDGAKKEVLEELKKAFKPEFINRIDKTIVFHPLNREHIIEIVKLQINYLQERLADKGIKIKAMKKALGLLAEKAYSPEYGARPAKRTIQTMVEDPITELILSGELNQKQTVTISEKDKELTFKVK